MSSSESRKDMRAVVTLVARYRSPTTFEYANESCSDVSVGGMFIMSAAPAPAGTLLKLECEADNATDAKIRGVARVVWLRRERNENGPSGMGVKFVKLEAGSRELIEGIIQRLAEAGVQARSISAAPEHQATGLNTSRPVQLVPSSPPSASETENEAAAEKADADLDAALDRGSRSDQLAPREAAPEAPAYAAAAQPLAALDGGSSADPSGSYPSTGSSRPPAAKPSRFGWKFWVVVIVLVLIAIAIADRRGRGTGTDAKSEAVAPAAEAPAAAAKAPEPVPAAAEPPPAPALPTPGQPVRQARVAQGAQGTQGAQGAQAEPEAANPEAAPGSSAPVATGAPLYPVGPNDKSYTIEFVSRPNAAIVTIDEKHTLTTPQVQNMGAMPSKVKVTAKKAGYQSSSIWLPREGFEEKDGMPYRRVYLTLKQESGTP